MIIQAMYRWPLKPALKLVDPLAGSHAVCSQCHRIITLSSTGWWHWYWWHDNHEAHPALGTIEPPEQEAA